MRRLLIIIPQLPPGCLNPNVSLHWAAKSAAARDYAYLVKMFALNAKHAWQMDNNEEWMPLARARVTLEFTWPLDQRGPMPDLKNLELAFKSGIDALTARIRGTNKRGNEIVGAGIIQDDSPTCIKWGPTLLQRGSEERVRITIEEI